jgi:uncharacterized protein with GYD domain
MPTYILLSTLTDDGAATVTGNPERVQEVNKEISKLGVTVREQYAVLGPFDFVSIVEAPDNATIARVSAELGSRGSVKITTLAALPMGEFMASLRRSGSKDKDKDREKDKDKEKKKKK